MTASRATAKRTGRIFLSTPIHCDYSQIPDATLIRACGTANEGHWAGTIAAPVTYVVDPAGKVKWAYASDSAADRPSPVALAKAACAVAAGKNAPVDYPGK